MKIAVIQAKDDPGMGGGHVFEASILQGLAEGHSGHVFQIFNLQGRLLQEQIVPTQHWTSGLTVPPDRSGDPQEAPADRSYLPVMIRRHGAEHDSNSDLATALAKQQVDFVWFPSPTCIDTALPTAVTVWDLEHRNKPYFPEVCSSGWTWDQREAFYQRYLPRAACVVVGTEVGQQEVIRYYGVNPENILINPFPSPMSAEQLKGLDIRLEASNDPSIRELAGEVFFLYPSQFWPHKNHANLVLALSMLRDGHGRTPKLVLTGNDKGNLGYIQSLIDSFDLRSQVRILGFVERQDLSRLYRHAVALVFASFFGPDNLPPLEAFSHGCPVLAAAGAGPREQLQEAALFFDPGEATDIAAAMLSALTRPDLRQELAGRGLRISQERTVQAYIERMLGFFDRFESLRFTWAAGNSYI